MAKEHKKTTLHPLSFSAGFIFGVLGTLNQNLHYQGAKQATRTLQLLSLFGFALGIYNLYRERRIAKGLRPLTECMSSLWNKIPAIYSAKPAIDSAPEKQNPPSLSTI